MELCPVRNPICVLERLEALLEMRKPRSRTRVAKGCGGQSCHAALRLTHEERERIRHGRRAERVMRSDALAKQVDAAIFCREQTRHGHARNLRAAARGVANVE